MSFAGISKNSAILLEALKDAFDEQQFNLLLNLVQTEVGMNVLCEYPWKTWEYVAKKNEVAVATLFHHFSHTAKAQMQQLSKYAAEEGKNDAPMPGGTAGGYDSNLDSSKLIIYAAIYGLADVTAIVRKKVNQKTQSLSIKAENGVFGDSWPNVWKSFIVVFGFGTGYVETRVVKEHETVHIDKSQFSSKYQAENAYGVINVLSAVYGLKEDSKMVQDRVEKHNLKVSANNHVFGDSFEGWRKTLVVVYRMGVANPRDPVDNVYVKIAQEGQVLAI